MDLDGTKRKECDAPTETRPRPYLPYLVNLGAATPPSTLAPYYHQESALRSTQSSSPYNAAAPPVDLNQRQPQNIQVNDWRTQPSAVHPAPEAVFPTCLEKDQSRLAAPGLDQLDKSPVADADHDEDEDEGDWEWGVDTDNGADHIYMTNHNVDDSWTKPLIDDNPEDLPLQTHLILDRLRQSQEAAEKERKLANDSLASRAHYALEQAEQARSNLEKETIRQQTDVLLRAIISGVKKKLQRGHKLVVECSDPVNLKTKCIHPLCAASDRAISPGAYYIILGQPRQLEGTES
ncbi:hypothetical protein Tdes44962_MAKER01929 [Teratosphaeria destructans]|uniref:Uncharacterized protein n=1 Tax=Teratosphaeria destructans TaxID=418781 RepID=A0A9W7SWK3_9PEZI|nr:hypothetical protein Tdes44962_MAKER01929 [Teratosphaeria destructans]